MNESYVIGAAMLQMGKYPGASYAGLGLPPVSHALKEAGVPPSDIGAVVCGHAFGGMLTGQRIVSGLGIGGVPVLNVENACSGGASAYTFL